MNSRVVLIIVLVMYGNVIGQSVLLNGVSFKLYDKPDTNSIQINIFNEECEWKLINKTGYHKHSYQFIFKEFDDTIKYEIFAYYGLVESSCGQVGYVHSSQLDFSNQGDFKLTKTYTTNSFVLENLPIQFGCSEFSEIEGVFRNQNEQKNFPLNTYWGFYSTDENCKSVINEYLYGCSFEFTYDIRRYYSWDSDFKWIYEINVIKSVVTNSPKMTVIGANVNIRKGPSKNYEIIGKLNPNDSFSIVEISHEDVIIDNYNGTWVKIHNEFYDGWIFNKFIQKQ